MCKHRLLTERKIQNDSDAIESMKMLHDMGAKTVVISSSVLGATEDSFSAFGSTSKYWLTIYGFHYKIIPSKAEMKDKIELP